MKFTLIVVLYAMSYGYTATTSTGSNTITSCSSNGTGSLNCATSSPQKVTRTIKIPMPDLKECLEARHQFDTYEYIIATACSAE